jgi:TRAP-type uncharacterized transport system substrate-binding protein
MVGFTPDAEPAPLHPARLSRQSRILIVVGIACLLAAVVFLSYRWHTRPTTLSIAVGSHDGEAVRLVTTIATQLAQAGAPVRLRMLEASSAQEAADAFSSGTTDLAVVRADVGDLSKAQTVLVMGHAVVLLVAPSGSRIERLAALKHVSIGVMGGRVNRKIVEILSNAYSLERADVAFRDLTQPDARRALQAKEVALLLVVIPATEKYLAPLRGLFPLIPKAAAPRLISIEIAGAIAEKERAYESFDLPKGTLHSSPPIPGDDLTTLRVTFYLVAKKELDNDLVACSSQCILERPVSIMATNKASWTNGET